MTRKSWFSTVRRYLTYKLSYRDLVAMMGERGIDLSHTTILRWVQHYTPEFHLFREWHPDFRKHRPAVLVGALLPPRWKKDLNHVYSPSR